MRPGSGSPRALFARAERRLQACPRPDLLTCLPARVLLSGPVLLREIRLTAARLVSSGVVEDSRVVVALAHPFFLTLSIPALWSLGCVPILADAASKPEELQEMGRDYSAGLVLGDHEEAPEGARTFLCPGLPLAWISRPKAGRPVVLPRRTVLVRTTSGSTGPPRGVALSAAQILADTLNILASLRIGPEVRGLAAIPLSHAYGFSTLLIPLLLHGHPMVLLERPLPEQFRGALGRDRSLFFPGVPYLFELLCRADIRPSLLARLGVCISAGAPLPAETASDFLRRSGRPVRNFYGASECGAIACDRTRRGRLPPGCVGTPLSGVRVFLEPVEGIAPEKRSPKGRVGRIGVTGDAVALGYVGGGRRAQFLRRSFVTPDLGRIDSRGRLHLLGRLDQMINVGGKKVRPEEVEQILARAPGVREAVAVGIRDASRGEAVAVAVTACPGVHSEELIQLCRRLLAPHKVPRRIQLLPALPRTSRGKVDRAVLRSILSAPPRSGGWS